MRPRRHRLDRAGSRSEYASGLARGSAARKALLGSIVVIAAALAAIVLWKDVPRSRAMGPAPDLVFESEGGIVRMSSLHGQPVLLSFIDTREHTTDRTDNPDMSRRLLVF